MLVTEGIAEILSRDQTDTISLPYGPRTGLLSTLYTFISHHYTNYTILTLFSLFLLRFRVFGDPPTHRTVEDIAFSVARFLSKNGSHVNYYMVR